MKTGSFFTSGDGPHLGLCGTHIESYLTHLRVAGYSERTLQNKAWMASSFARWSVEKQLAVSDLNESHLAAFVERSPGRRKSRVKFEMATLQPFLEYLRAEAGVPIPPLVIDIPPEEDLKQRYIDYLRKERGLTEYSVRVYAPFITAFLNEQVAHNRRHFPR